MIRSKKQATVVSVPVSVVCDRCGKEYDAERDVFDIQEFYRIDFTGGYTSVFGDGSRVEADICQHCLRELIGDFCYTDGVKQGENDDAL